MKLMLSMLFAAALFAADAKPNDLVDPHADRVIHLSAHVPMTAAAAFGAFVDERVLEKWLTTGAHVEPKTGGAYELFWDPEHPEDNSTIGCRITALHENQLIAFQWRSPKEFKHFANAADPLTHVVVTFIPSESGTNIHLVHSGWRRSAEWEQARQWQERAWRAAFGRLVP